jgi:uncharacterized membrane protein YedE/YeeE
VPSWVVAFSFRPSFALDLQVPSGQLVDQIASGLSSMPLQLRRTRVPGGGDSEPTRRDRDQLVITVLPEARHFSPWLTIEIDPRGDGAHVSATFSPHPSVWTGYMFGYLALGIVLLFSLLFAAAVVMMDGGMPWSLWVAGGAVAGMLAMWWASVLGQRLAAAQMDELRGALTHAIEQATPRA